MSVALALHQHQVAILLRHGDLQGAELLATHMAWLCLMAYGRHPATIVALNNLGIIKAKRGHIQEAEALLRHALGATLHFQRREIHQLSVSVMINLEQLLIHQEKLPEAQELHALALQMQQP